MNRSMLLQISKASMQELELEGNFLNINLRTVFAFREMGKGLEAIVNFCQIMNMLRPFTQTAYDQCLDELHCNIQAEVNDSLQKVAEKHMLKTDLEIMKMI